MDKQRIEVSVWIEDVSDTFGASSLTLGFPDLDHVSMLSSLPSFLEVHRHLNKRNKKKRWWSWFREQEREMCRDREKKKRKKLWRREE